MSKDICDAPSKTTRHTSGWSCKDEVLLVNAHADQCWNEAVVVGDASSNELVAMVFGYSPEGCHRRARLISAAPDLLEALKGLLRNYVQIADSGDCGNWDAATEPQVIAARAAIAKAEGR